jgi:hypothetical protein
MSLTSRRVIDGIKGKVGGYFRLPSPPFGLSSFWNSVFRDCDPSTVVEWGDLTLGKDLMEYDYRLRSINDNSLTETARTTFAQTIGVYPNEDGRSIMILGSGYSRLGEDMASQGWKGIVQVDVVSKAILDLSKRCTSWDKTVMQCVEDDASVLSAFDSETMGAVIDKGLMDALFLGDEHAKMRDIMRSTHRVLRPNGTVCIFSFSQPAYLLPTLMPNDLREDPHRRWHSVEVQQLDTALLYRFRKSQRTESIKVTTHPFIKKRKHR